MKFRLATGADLPQLASMRWNFRDGIRARQWAYWVAESIDSLIIAHMAVGVIRAVPRPARLQDAWGYLTDSYTRPTFRQQGIGSTLLQHVIAWASAEDLEMLLVWPSERAHHFYERAGFVRHAHLHVLRLREFDAPFVPAPAFPTFAV